MADKKIVTKTVTSQVNKPKVKKTKVVQRATRSMQQKEAPVAIGVTLKTTPNSGKAPSRIADREPLGSIIGTTSAFSIASTYSVNPGLPATFPWLSGPMSSYSMYTFNKLRIWYLNSTNTTNTGVVVIAFNPDTSDQGPSTLVQAENFPTRVRVSAWENAFIDVPRSALKRIPKFFVRTSIVPGDLSDYDIGTIFVCCSGNNSNSAVIGEIWLQYELEAFSPMPLLSAPPPAKANSVYTAITQTLPTSGTTTITFPTSVFNALNLVNIAGVFTGISGALTIYAQITMQAATLTSGYISLVRNGAIVLSSAFPALLNNTSTANIFGVLSLLPTDTFQVTVTAVGTSIQTAVSAGQSTLIITAA